ncbi:MAG: Holliday junction branch migration protein RuvA, partial [Bacteroidota bacterium]
SDLLHVKEDSHTLYGFFNVEERKLFKLLISVSGIGPNTGRIILSSMTPIEVSRAILSNNVAAFKKVKGVGPKTAQRVILDLRDKVDPVEGVEVAAPVQSQNTELMNQAGSALLALGFNKMQVQKAILAVMKTKTDIKTVEELIKLALNQLS